MTMMDEGAPPPDDDQPIGQSASQSANSPKQSQQEANYREGNPQRSCGLCGHFDSKGHSCDVVEGDISPFGFSDRYLRQDNPFRTGEKEAFKGGTKVAMISPVAAGRATSRAAADRPQNVWRCSVRALVLGVVLLAANIGAAQAEDRHECIRKYKHFIFDDMTTTAKRLCDPKNFVSNPNEYGWVCYDDRGLMRVKGHGAKLQKDAPCATE